ncbi:MAG: S8 family serine peptidase [Thermoplasmatota archaeon]
MSRVLKVLAFALLLAIPVLPVIGGSETSGVPNGIDPWETREVIPFDWSGWDRDVNGNRIDDLLEEDPSTLDGDGSLVGINVHFDHYPTYNDALRIMGSLLELGPGSTFLHAGKYSTALYLTVPRPLIPGLQGIFAPDITMIEYRPVFVNYLDVSSPATRARDSTTYSPMTATDLGYTGEGLVVAVIDSGVDNNVHESLRGKYVYGVDFTGTTTIPGLDPDDIDGHGTHVAGTVMGTGGNSGTYQGTAPAAQLVDLRYARVQGDFTGAADRALEWVIENHLEFDIRVVSCSWGSTVFTTGRDTTSRLVNQLVDEGVAVVVAAGNDGEQGMPSPASADGAITVGAVNDHSTIERDDDDVEYYSNYGPRSSDGDNDRIDELKPDVVAPGRQIRAPKHNSIADYVDMSGTSMATPHVSGIVALMLEADPSLTPRDIKQILRDTAQQRFSASRPDLDEKYNYRSGWGAIDAYGAVKRSQDLRDFGLFVPDEVRLNDPTDVSYAGHFTKTDYDTQGDQVLMEVRTPGDWGVPTDIWVDPDSTSAQHTVQGPVLLGSDWVVRILIDYNDTTEQATPGLGMKVRPFGRIGETRTFRGSVSINGIDGRMEEMNSTIIYDSLPPDLSITPLAVWISETRPETGDRITITARVNNTGSTYVEDALVRFIDGPERTGTVIGEDTMDIESGSFGIAEVTWEANAGIHAITVIADPEDEIDESNEDNNSAERPVSVLGFNSPPIAQLEVTPQTGTTITEFTFDGSGSTDTNIRGGAVVSYNFDFGDGTSTGWIDQPTITHFYKMGGTFNAKLRVKDNGGEESTNEDEVQVNVTGVSSLEMDLYLNGSLGLSAEPGRSAYFAVPTSLSPLEIGKWRMEPVERTIILHTAVRPALVFEAAAPSLLEVRIEILTETGEAMETSLFEHPGSGSNMTFEVILDIEELEVKSGEIVELSVSVGSNRSGVRLWAGERGSTTTFLYYFKLNQVPTADAGADLDVKALSEVEFSGSAEDPDGEIVRSRWDVESDGDWEFDSETSLTFYYSGYEEEGQYTARFEVMDDDGYWSSDTVKVLVRSADYNYPPEVTLECPEGPLSGKVTIRGTASDDGNIDRVDVRIEGDGYSMNWAPADGKEDWDFQLDTKTLENGDYTIYARAYDGDRYSAVANCEVRVQNPNSPPEIIRVITAPQPLPLDGNTPLLLTAEVEDPDLPGDLLTVVADLSSMDGPARVVMRDDGTHPDPVEGDGVFSLEFLPSLSATPGIHMVTVTVIDSEGASDGEEVEVEIVAEADCTFTVSDDRVFEGQIIHMELRVDSVIPIRSVFFVSEIILDGGRIELKDDGRDGDRVAGDSIYGADLQVLASPGTYNYSVEVVCESGSELMRTSGEIEVYSLSTATNEGFSAIIAVVIVAFVILSVLVILFLLVILPGSRSRPVPVEEAVVVQASYPVEPPETEEVLVAEVLE